MEEAEAGLVERRRAGVVAAVAGLALVPYFWFASALVGWPGHNAPAADAPARAFVDYYATEASQVRRAATVAIGLWVLWLALVVAAVRWACRRLDFAAVFAMTLAGASVAVFVAAEGVMVWPAIAVSAREIAEHLDPEIARASVMSRDGLHAAASVPWGVSMLVVAWLFVRSDLRGRWVLGGVGVLAGVSACTTMFQGSDPLGPGGSLCGASSSRALFSSTGGMREVASMLGDPRCLLRGAARLGR